MVTSSIYAASNPLKPSPVETSKTSTASLQGLAFHPPSCGRAWVAWAACPSVGPCRWWRRTTASNRSRLGFEPLNHEFKLGFKAKNQPKWEWFLNLSSRNLDFASQNRDLIWFDMIWSMNHEEFYDQTLGNTEIEKEIRIPPPKHQGIWVSIICRISPAKFGMIRGFGQQHLPTGNGIGLSNIWV